MTTIKNTLLFTAVLAIQLVYSQDDDYALNRHMVAMQFGGQTIVSLHYEYALVKREHQFLKINTGLGFNASAQDDKDPDDRSMYGLHTGLIYQAGTAPIFLELGLTPTTYFYKSTTFVNLNAWVGLKITPKHISGPSLSVGYTPRLYTDYSDPDNRYNNIMIGVKGGVTF